ncbi:MAG: alpha/beta hydrolase [Clostridiales bacterium]|nr:alpha/beta hydrolase [Clostridiales bacterium]
MHEKLIEAKFQEFWDFPSSDFKAEGMEVIGATLGHYVVRFRHFVKYAEKDGTELHLNLHLPERGDEKLPLAIFIPGSAWRKQNIDDTTAQMANFARRGFIVAQIEYRASSVAKFPAQIRDTRTAARFLLSHAEEFHIDKERVFIWGDSSGAHTAVMTALTEGDPYFQDEEGEALPIKAIVDYYGPTDIAKMNFEPSIMDHISWESPEGMLIGGKNVLENPELADETVVMNYITKEKQIAPLLIIHGDKDRLVPFGQSILLYNKMLEMGKEARLIKMKWGDHGAEDFWSDRVFDIVEDFVRKMIG